MRFRRQAPPQRGKADCADRSEWIDSVQRSEGARSASEGCGFPRMRFVLRHFQDVGLAPTATDVEIWQCCQAGN